MFASFVVTEKDSDSVNSGGLSSNPTSHLRSIAERDARAMEAAARAMEEATKRVEAATSESPSSRLTRDSTPSSSVAPPNLPRKLGSSVPSLSDEPPSKRLAMEEDRIMAQMGMRSAHLKITSRGIYTYGHITFITANLNHQIILLKFVKFTHKTSTN